MALVVTAANTAVTLLVTDGWQRVSTGLGDLWRQAQPNRASAVEAELLEARDQIVAARAAGPAQSREIEEALVDEWQARLRRLLAANPELVAELRRLVNDEWTPALPAQSRAWAGDVTMHATASGQGRVYQVGQGEQHISGS